MREAVGHRWSGWPGAWCLDCGIGDPWEQALADGLWEPDYDKKPGEEGALRWLGTEEQRKALDAASECTEPGSKRCDPYHQRSEMKRIKEECGGDSNATVDAVAKHFGWTVGQAYQATEWLFRPENHN